MRRLWVVLTAAMNLVLADAVTKEIAAGCLKGAAAVPIIPGFFDLAYVENRGCAWGLFQGRVWPLAAFGLLALGVLFWRRRAVFGTGAAAFVSECLLYAGIVGNLIDRVFRGYVIDFLSFHWHSAWYFPCFNLADTFICTAVGLLFLCSFEKHTS